LYIGLYIYIQKLRSIMPNYRMVKTRTRAPRRRIARRGVRRGKKGGKIHWGRVWGKVKRFGSKANKFLKKTKAISTVAPLFGKRGVAIGKVAGLAGYGRRRRMVRSRRYGRGINVPGGSRGRGIRLAGRGKKKYTRMSY
jgi:hypothetical protein